MSRFDELIGAVKTSQPSELGGRTSEHLNAQTAKSPDIQLSKSKDPSYQRTTLYLPKDLHRQFKAAAVNRDQEMSEIMEHLINEWLDGLNA